jgi:hypothetical protein
MVRIGMRNYTFFTFVNVVCQNITVTMDVEEKIRFPFLTLYLSKKSSKNLDRKV